MSTPANTAPTKTASPLRLTALLCLAEVLVMLNNAFPALLPQFQAEWRLNNGELGWLSGMYYGGYVLATLPLVALTDARDPRRIYLWAALLCAVSSLAFALLAGGFWSALGLRVLGGVGLAGTYMVGLRILTDRTEGRTQSRAIAFYTSHFAIGNAASVWVAGAAARWIGWQGAYHLAAIGAALALLILLFAVAPAATAEKPVHWRQALDLRPALRNRRALGYNLAYACHGWELFAFRSFLVSFLVFAASGRGLPLGLAATDLAGLVLLLGLPGSVGGNELVHRFGRERVIAGVMFGSALLGLAVAGSAAGPFWLFLPLLACYGLSVAGESAAVTGGAVAAAASGRRGATLAVHSILGFAVAAPAPVVFGYLLDLGGGEGEGGAWLLAFAALSIGVALGPLLLAMMLRPRPGKPAP